MTSKSIILISGKRKTGKDFLSNKLQEKLGNKSQIIRISEPIKTSWAKEHHLDLNQLLSSGFYKERYRKEMIEWSETVRATDSGYFCRQAMLAASSKIIIVSDIRRKTDIEFFTQTYPNKVKKIRINTSPEIRKERGWSFVADVDDVKSECDLDNYEDWDLILSNNGNDASSIIEKIIETFDLY